MKVPDKKVPGSDRSAAGLKFDWLTRNIFTISLLQPVKYAPMKRHLYGYSFIFIICLMRVKIPDLRKQQTFFQSLSKIFLFS